jgi:hypothetical protein
MKISELIAELTKHLEQHGDVPVALADWQEQWARPNLDIVNKDTIYVDPKFQRWENRGTDKVESVLIIGWF